MPVPDYQTIMLPLLEILADGQARRGSEINELVAHYFHLAPEDRATLLPSGQRSLENRVGWASTYLVKARLLERPSRAHVRITPRGKELLAMSPGRVDNRLLSQYPEFVAFKQASATGPRSRREQSGAQRGALGAPELLEARADVEEANQSAIETPEEAIGRAHQQIEAALADDILIKIKGLSAQFFERLVVDLLVAMGYGGTMQDAAQVVGQSGDGGIDGVIKEDKLGLDNIYVQAKRWENTVGRPDVQGFVGSLTGKQATKGVFITTAAFSSDAREYVKYLPMRIVLIDGSTLARLMIEHRVGVAVAWTYQIKRVDSDYFTEE